MPPSRRPSTRSSASRSKTRRSSRSASTTPSPRTAARWWTAFPRPTRCLGTSVAPDSGGSVYMNVVTPLRVPSVRDAVSEEEWNARVDLATCYRLIARYGWADLTATHTSVEVPGTDRKHFLINPHGMLFEQVTASSLVKIDV